MIKPQDFKNTRRFGPVPSYPLVESYIHPNNDFIVIAGSCSVESSDQVFDSANFVSRHGATHLRGGVFGLEHIQKDAHFGWVDRTLIAQFHEAAKAFKLKNIIEVLDYSEHSLDMISKYADCFQVGARSMQNYSLLRILGCYGKPVFLKRNTGATVDEWLGAAEHLLIGGVKELYLIERGSSTFHNDARWTPCLHTIPSVKSVCNIPVIMDASHGTGRRDLVPALTLAGVAAGAGGILVETHVSPENSISDSEQAIDYPTFINLMNSVSKVRNAIREN